MKNKIFKIEWTIYPFDTIVSIWGTNKEAIKNMIDFWVSEETASNVCNEEAQWRAVMYKNWVTIIRLKHEPKCAVSLAYMAHEIFHTTFFLMDRIWIDLTPESDEAFAYYIWYLTRTILENTKR